MYLTFPLSSALYGKVAMETPAIRAASSMERPTKERIATAHTKKHQASARISMSSGELEAFMKTAGKTYFEYEKATTMRNAMKPNVPSRPVIWGLSMFGWMASMTIAQMSWKIRMPMVRRPAVVSVSIFSDNSFTTIIVDEMPHTIAAYTVAMGPSPNEIPAAARPMKMQMWRPTQMGNWRAPVISTTFPIFSSSFTFSSRPTMKRRKMRPKELKVEMSSWLCMMFRTWGPTATPPSK
mmetsp:Transcript_117061/g.309292  ORF Transcript_117061/g.309292 Transcript_117061/m.309292 type:complete len:238 (+) Transcript_117061:1130-1843(+)